MVRILQKGELIKGESYLWLSTFRNYIGKSVVDILLNYISTLIMENNQEEIINLSDIISKYDPLNEKVLQYKMKIFNLQNNQMLAKYSFEQFCESYKELHGREFSKTIDQLMY